ncbi:MAG: hypothetical protein ACK5MW_03395 [Enterococcus sp.]
MQYLTANDEIIFSDKVPMKKKSKNPILKTTDGRTHLIIGEIVGGELKKIHKFKEWKTKSEELEEDLPKVRRTDFTVKATNEVTGVSKLFSTPAEAAKYFGVINATIGTVIKRSNIVKKGPLKGWSFDYANN